MGLAQAAAGPGQCRSSPVGSTGEGAGSSAAGPQVCGQGVRRALGSHHRPKQGSQGQRSPGDHAGGFRDHSKGDQRGWFAHDLPFWHRKSKVLKSLALGKRGTPARLEEGGSSRQPRASPDRQAGGLHPEPQPSCPSSTVQAELPSSRPSPGHRNQQPLLGEVSASRDLATPFQVVNKTNQK